METRRFRRVLFQKAISSFVKNAAPRIFEIENSADLLQHDERRRRRTQK